MVFNKKDMHQSIKPKIKQVSLEYAKKMELKPTSNNKIETKPYQSFLTIKDLISFIWSK